MESRNINESCSGGPERPLSNIDIARYSRQMILPEFGPRAQIELKSKSALVVGMGGLGSPASMYLASSGIGTLGLLDYDVVEISNLHRQIIHSETNVGLPKVTSAKNFLSNLNSSIQIIPHDTPLDSSNAMEIVNQYDVVLDCTDNAATRYLLNDACVLAGKPLVSGSALRFEGQLTTYSFQGGPCYRCLFPVPPKPEYITNCSDGGVLGPIPGIIGTMQALEAIKILAGMEANYVQKLLLFDGLHGTFNNIKIRPRQNNCAVCGENPTITKILGSQDYVTFCGGAGYNDKDKGITLLPPKDRIDPEQFAEKLNSEPSLLLLDVRAPEEYQMCSLPAKNQHNFPYNNIKAPLVLKDLEKLFRKQFEIPEIKQEPNISLGDGVHPLGPLGTVYVKSDCLETGKPPENSDLGTEIPSYTKFLPPLPEPVQTTEPSSFYGTVHIVCRRGNDSQRAAEFLTSKFQSLGVKFQDIRGGLHGWNKTVDKEFPIY